jgi:hypothetical protein
MNMWHILIGISAIALYYFWQGVNAVWGGGSLGLIGGLIGAAYVAFLGKGFQWPIVGKGIVIGVLLGVVAELLGRLSAFMRH